MTPLERAKAFVKSRAARTALKIMPLALAAVTATTTAAKADVVIHPTDASFNGCVVGPGQDCSGLFKLTGESGIALSQLGLVGGVNGAHSQGIGDGRFPLNFPLSSNWDFTVNGDGAGVTTDSFFQAGVDTVPISWDFTLGSSNTALTYDWSIFYSFTDTSSTTVSGTCDSGLGVAAGTDAADIGIDRIGAAFQLAGPDRRADDEHRHAVQHGKLECELPEHRFVADYATAPDAGTGYADVGCGCPSVPYSPSP